jgi:hypothetical protein
MSRPIVSSPRLLIAALCDDVRTEVRGKVSLMGLFDNFSVSGVDKPLPPFRLYARIGVTTPGEHAVRLKITSVDEDFEVELPGKLVARETSQASGLHEAVMTLGITGLVVPRAGRYRLRFVIDGIELDGPMFTVTRRERRNLN